MILATILRNDNDGDTEEFDTTINFEDELLPRVTEEDVELDMD